MLKWVNYTTGYKTRYFVLQEGVLSYYHSEQDFPSDCRGSISTGTVTTEFPDSSDHCRFDVTSAHATWSLKARSPADAKKWVWSIMESQRWVKDRRRASSPAGADKRDVVDQLVIVDSSPIELGSSAVEAGGALEATEIHQIRPNNDSPGFPEPPELQWDMSQLLYLLNVQVASQQRAVESAIKLLNSDGGKDKLAQLPSLLLQATESVKATTMQISALYDSKEHLWRATIEEEVENRRRLEQLMQKFLASQHKEQHRRQSVSSALSEGVHAEEGNTTEDDVFYDADEEFGDAFLENTLGFETYTHKADTLPRKSEEYPEGKEEYLEEELLPDMALSFVDPSLIERVSSGYPQTSRKALPLDSNSTKPKLALWSFLKSAIGKDLTKIPLPVLFNEPLSMLQRMCEDVEHIELLSLASALHSGNAQVSDVAKAAAAELNMDITTLVGLQEEALELVRLMLVSAFAMSNYSSTPGRLNKPFNPLLVHVLIRAKHLNL